MSAFLRDLPDNHFLLTGLLAGLLASVACGTVGPWVITRRIVFLAGAIAHMAVAGIGAVILLRARWTDAPAWLEPVHGATVAAVAGAILVGIVHERAAERIDTLIGAMWAVGMSAGIAMAKLAGGYQVELMSALFGNVATVPWSMIRMMALLDVVVVLAILAIHKRLLATCLDPAHARLQGAGTARLTTLLLVLVALTVVLLMQVVGLILVIALLTLPAATAGHHVRRLAPMAFGAIGIGCLVTTLPRVAVYGTRLSPESAIVFAAAGAYLVSLGLRRVRRAAA